MNTYNACLVCKFKTTPSAIVKLQSAHVLRFAFRFDITKMIVGTIVVVGTEIAFVFRHVAVARQTDVVVVAPLFVIELDAAFILIITSRLGIAEHKFRRALVVGLARLTGIRDQIAMSRFANRIDVTPRIVVEFFATYVHKFRCVQITKFVLFALVRRLASLALVRTLVAVSFAKGITIAPGTVIEF